MPPFRRLRFDASVSAVHSVRPVRPAVPASATCGRLSRYLQLLAARPGIRNSRPASPVHAGSHSSGSGGAVSVGFRRVGRLRVSRPPPAGSSASVGLRRVAPPRLKKTTTASGGVVPRCGCRLVRRSGRTGPEPLYFLLFGASIMFIFLPSSLGIISTLAYSSRSVAKRSSRISPCSLKTIERPRKKT